MESREGGFIVRYRRSHFVFLLASRFNKTQAYSDYDRGETDRLTFKFIDRVVRIIRGDLSLVLFARYTVYLGAMLLSPFKNILSRSEC